MLQASLKMVGFIIEIFGAVKSRVKLSCLYKMDAHILGCVKGTGNQINLAHQMLSG
jgi:hypothetical protein